MLTTDPVSSDAPASLLALVPPVGGPHTSTTTMAVSELRAVGFTDADIDRHLGVPDRVGPRGGRRYSPRDVALLREVQRLSQEYGVNRRYSRARAALVVARHPQMLNSYAGRHGWWSSLKLLGEGLAVPVPYVEMVIVPWTGLGTGDLLAVHGSAPVVVTEVACTYEGLSLVRAELASTPPTPEERLAALPRPDAALLEPDPVALAAACAQYAATVLELAPDLHFDAQVAAAAEHSRVYSEIAGALARHDRPGAREALALIHDVPAADPGSMARTVRALALAHAARRA